MGLATLGLADPDGVHAVLTQAGLGNIDIEPLIASFWVGGDASDAFAFVRRIGMVRGMLQGLDDANRNLALAQL